MWFLANLELYKTVKPYRLDFEPEDPSFPRTNVERVEIPNVPIRDIRAYEGQLELSKCGFSVVEMPAELMSLDYDNKTEVVDKYYSFLETAVTKVSEKYGKGAQVVLLDHKIRKRHSGFPISHGKNYSDPQPVLVAHVDWTPESIAKKLRTKVGSQKTDSIMAKRYQFFHAWRPLFTPLRDFPLAVCDYSTVDSENDLEPCDDVHGNIGVDENYVVYHKPGHRWYYISDQKATEILLFRQFDSAIGIRSGVPHCAIPNPIPFDNIPPRQSIEVEMVVYWE